jgi:hypothetical protein
MENEKKILMAVAFDETNNTYSVDLGAGSSVPETALAMSIVIKCLLKDGIIKDASEITDLVNKYLTDPQYQEVKETEGE